MSDGLEDAVRVPVWTDRWWIDDSESIRKKGGLVVNGVASGWGERRVICRMVMCLYCMFCCRGFCCGAFVKLYGWRIVIQGNFRVKKFPCLKNVRVKKFPWPTIICRFQLCTNVCWKIFPVFNFCTFWRVWEFFNNENVWIAVSAFKLEMEQMLDFLASNVWWLSTLT